MTNEQIYHQLQDIPFLRINHKATPRVYTHNIIYENMKIQRQGKYKVTRQTDKNNVCEIY